MQREIAQQIIAGGADYVLAVKDQGRLHEGIRDLFHGVLTGCLTITDRGQGTRTGRRECWTITATDCLDYLDPQGQFN